MSQSVTQDVEVPTVDVHEIGWYIESADEDIYGPVSRKTIRTFLEDGTITPNTLVRHCTQVEAKPVADQLTIIADLNLESSATALGDRLPEVWPRKKKDQLDLAGGSVRCAWHDKSWLKKPATLFCVRCHAPYCNSCRAKPFRKQFFFCRRCQLSLYNRRVYAYIVDTALYLYLPLYAIILPMIVLTSLGGGAAGNEARANMIVFIAYIPAFILMLVRDALTRGASLGKRLNGLRVVQSKDGTTPLTYGQGALRWVTLLIPFFNVYDLIIPFRDPLMCRFGDRWANTRVIDSVTKLAKARAKISSLLSKRGIQLPPPAEMGMTMSEFARTV